MLTGITQPYILDGQEHLIGTYYGQPLYQHDFTHQLKDYRGQTGNKTEDITLPITNIDTIISLVWTAENGGLSNGDQNQWFHGYSLINPWWSRRSNRFHINLPNVEQMAPTLSKAIIHFIYAYIKQV